MTPRVRPYKRKKPGGKRKTVHVKGHYRRKTR